MTDEDQRFEEWWARAGKSIDPDTSDVSWHDKRKGLAAAAFSAATAQGMNYTCDKACDPTEVTFANGRRVWIRFDECEDPYLEIARSIPLKQVRANISRGGFDPEAYEMRYASRSNPHRIEKVERMARIFDSLLDAIVYLYPDERSAMEGERIGGTGFLLSEPLPNNRDIRQYYVVTNKHVVDGGSSVVRLNTLTGTITTISLDERRWWSLPDESDIVIQAVYPEDEIHHYAILPSECLLTKELVAKHGIGPGDDTFVLGRFVNHEGKQKNLPTARFGNIAQMPHEAVVADGLIPQESLLVESRSIAGYSGSPVFVQIPSWSLRPGTKNISSDAFGPWLLGIAWCMVPGWDPVCTPNGKPVSTGLMVPANTGMMGVIPAWKIRELLDRPEVAQERIEIEIREMTFRAKLKPPAAVATTALSQQKTAHSETAENPGIMTQTPQDMRAPQPDLKGRLG